MPRHFITLAILALMAVLTIAACGSDAQDEAPGAYTVSPEEAVALIEDGRRTVVDVRMPSEYAQAHVVGALNIDVEADDFADRIAKLDPDESYLVYCRTGRRSAIAAEQMAVAGFKDIADAGGLADLARVGAPVE